MNCLTGSEKQQKLLTEIIAFIGRTTGLSCQMVDDDHLQIHQQVDAKSIIVSASLLDEILYREDTEGREFLQVNFTTNVKILVTDSLIGFKPSTTHGLDATKLPRVVTTPDIMSVFEAIQDALHSPLTDNHEISVLKKVYDAVLSGGESVGFDLALERSWIARIPAYLTKVPA